jgi:DNA mismatch repair protein MutS2
VTPPVLRQSDRQSVSVNREAGPSPIELETLELLEWPLVCQQVATFAATALGARAALSLVLPRSRRSSERLLAQTQEVYDLEARTSLSFEGIQDVGDAIERASLGGLLSGDELLGLATTLAGARTLRRTINGEEQLVQLNEIVADLRTYPELEQQIHHCIDDRGDVADRASDKLAGLRTKLKSQRDAVYQKLQRILQRHSNAVQEAVITQRDGRFVIPVKASHRDHIPGIVHDSSSSGATLYVEPHNTVEPNNYLRQTQRAEQVEEERVRQQLSEQVAAVSEDLERLLAICTTVDLAAARARYSDWLGAKPPRFIDFDPAQQPDPGVRREDGSSGPVCITLRQLRHPLLIWQQRQGQGPEVVPIDLRIEPRLRVVAITGPNTGGKTVTLKTFGLAALMAKAGLFVPAKDPVALPWFDQILADIGDEQSLQQSLSTFSGHIRRIGRILEAIGPRSPEDLAPSLVLFDEVGAGTDPTEGAALATALLKSLADRALLTIATTHFGELKALKYGDDRFENASVEFDDESMSPTYRLLWGIPGRSNALAIAQRLGLELAIVEDARQHLSPGGSTQVNEVIAGLEAQRRQQEEKAAAAAQLLSETERLHGELNRTATELQRREQQLRREQEQAVQAAIGEAKTEIAQVIRQLQRGPQSSQAQAQRAQSATEALNTIAQREKTQARVKPSYLPKVGERIRISRLGQVAEVITAPNEAGEINVRFGIMKMTVSLNEIESLQGEKPAAISKDAKKQEARKQEQKKQEAKVEMAPAIRTSRNTFDYRGQKVADAEMELDRAICAAEGAIWVIHGHGTGKLRSGIHEYLKQHPLVDRFEAADQADGGTGVTVVFVK